MVSYLSRALVALSAASPLTAHSMILVAAALLSFLHPGIFFPQMAGNKAASEDKPAGTPAIAMSTTSQEHKSTDSA